MIIFLFKQLKNHIAIQSTVEISRDNSRGKKKTHNYLKSRINCKTSCRGVHTGNILCIMDFF